MILLTGGTGLVGSHLLVQLVEKDYKVRAIYRSKESIKEAKKIFQFYHENYLPLWKKIEWYPADLTDYFALEEALEGVRYVIHSAAMVSFNPHESDKMLSVNSEGTANLMNACLKKEIKKVCYVSSVSSLGKQVEGGFIHEDLEWQPDSRRSAYSHSKFRAEMEVWRAAKEGLPVVIVNPSVIIGPVSWKRSSGKLFYSVKKGMPFYTNGVVGFVDVRDVAKAIVLLMESDVVNERFILNSENLPFKELFTMIAQSIGKKPPKFKVSRCITEVGWRLDLLLCFISGKVPAITRDTARSAHSKSYFSNEKFRTKFNYTFISVEEAVKNAARWFKS